MSKSKRAIAFERIRFSDPGWEATPLPVSGSGEVAIIMAKQDVHTGRTMYGQVLAQYKYPTAASKLCAELNDFKQRMFATAYP